MSRLRVAFALLGLGIGAAQVPLSPGSITDLDGTCLLQRGVAPAARSQKPSSESTGSEVPRELAELRRLLAPREAPASLPERLMTVSTFAGEPQAKAFVAPGWKLEAGELRRQNFALQRQLKEAKATATQQLTAAQELQRAARAAAQKARMAARLARSFGGRDPPVAAPAPGKAGSVPLPPPLPSAAAAANSTGKTLPPGAKLNATAKREDAAEHGGMGQLQTILIGCAVVGGLIALWCLATLRHFFTVARRDVDGDGDIDLNDFQEYLVHRYCCCSCTLSLMTRLLEVFLFSALVFGVMWKFGIIQPVLKQLVCYVFIILVLLAIVSAILGELFAPVAAKADMVAKMIQKMDDPFAGAGGGFFGGSGTPAPAAEPAATVRPKKAKSQPASASAPKKPDPESSGGFWY